VGPILGGIILSIAKWQWLFLINLPIALVVIILGLRLLPNTHAEQTKAFDWPGILILSAMLASFAYGINQINTSDFFNSLISLNVWPVLSTRLYLASPLSHH
jgi:predicted MFS family arabinose efflux permease